MTDNAVAVRGEERDPALALDRVIVAGDLSKLSPADRVTYYRTVCESIGLNPFTKPFDYIVLSGRLTLYATKTATDQLRSLRGISIDSAERDTTDPDYATWLVTGHDSTGRTDMEIGSVHIAGLKGEGRANAIMKALTKGKRRLTLSLSGLGFLDETEVGSVPSAQEVDVDQETGEIRRLPLREQVAARRAALTGAGSEVAPPPSEPPRPDAPEARSAEPPPVDAGATTDIPAGKAGRTARGNPMPAPHPGDPAPEGVAADGQPSPSAPPEEDEEVAARPLICSNASPYDDGDTCDLRAGHRNAHRGAQATWT